MRQQNKIEKREKTMNTILQKRIEEAADEYQNLVIEETKCHHNHTMTYAQGYEDARLLVKPTFIDAADWALQNQWISVEEDLPPYDKAVIGMDYMPKLDWDEQTIIFVHRSDNPNVVTDKNKFCVYPPTFCKVTHWMIIPSLEGGKE